MKVKAIYEKQSSQLSTPLLGTDEDLYGPHVQHCARELETSRTYVRAGGLEPNK